MTSFNKTEKLNKWFSFTCSSRTYYLLTVNRALPLPRIECMNAKCETNLLVQIFGIHRDPPFPFTFTQHSSCQNEDISHVMTVYWYKTTGLSKKKHQFFYCFNTNSISSIWRYWKHVRHTFKIDHLIFQIISSSLSPLSSPSPLPAMLTTSLLITPHRNTRHRNTPHQLTPRNTNTWVAWTTVF